MTDSTPAATPTALYPDSPAGLLADGPTTPEEFESIRAERAAGGTGDRRAKP